jgi:hypothetical protein
MATKKRKGGKRKTKQQDQQLADGGAPQGLSAMPANDDVMIMVDDGSGAEAPVFDPAEGAIVMDNDDGTITIELAEPEEEVKKDPDFDDNLAEHLEEGELTRIVQMLDEGVLQDESRRSEWLEQRASGLDLLGMKLERPGGGNVGSSSTAVPGQSTVRDGLLSEAIDRFQANAFAELCPADGPCKIVNYGTETTGADGLAEEFEKDINYYLSSGAKGTATEYYPDTRKMLWWVGYSSGMFKKVYKCPLRNRPVSESVDGRDLIVSQDATDLHNAGRITQQINMRQSTMKRMQLLGNYRNVPLTSPTPMQNAVTAKEATITGLNKNMDRPEDQTYTIYEVYCELDIPGFEHKKNGEPTGLPLPYRVSYDKDSRVILEIRRNWAPPQTDEEEDELPVARIPFVLFPYASGLGLYGTGLLQRLGNYTQALTAMLRESIDAGMFASFPGFLFAKPMGRQMQNEFRVPPGGGAPIDVSASGGDIHRAVMPLPYKDVSTAMVALMAQTREQASRYGGTAEMPTGEGVANAPVGSVLAAIDQSTRIEGGVHKALYAAQKEELQLLLELFREDPEALWRGNKRPAMGGTQEARIARFKEALASCDLEPASDPNVPSHMHRLAKATALTQVAVQFPGAMDPHKVISRWGKMTRIDDIDSMFAPLPPPGQQEPADPVAGAMVGLKAQELQVKQAQIAAQNEQKEKDRASKEQIEAMKLASQHMLSKNDQQPPDPLRHAELGLKERQVGLKEQELLVKSHNAQQDREMKLGVEALKIAQTVGVHPEADGIVDQQLMQMEPYLKPATESGGAGGRKVGGPVEAEEDETVSQVHKALAMARALQDYAAGPPNPARWWQ